MKAEDVKFVYVNRALRGLRPVLGEWTSILANYLSATSYEDCPWWYNERASLSALAGAAWRCRGWIALEEYATRKRGRVPKTKVTDGSIKKGRCDLYVSSNSKGYAIEAKQLWQPASRKWSITSAMKHASQDAGALDSNEADFRLGGVFTALHFSTRNQFPIHDRDAMHSHVREWISNQDWSEFDAYAYYFTPRCGLLVNQKKSRVFPGTVVTFKQRRRANKVARE